MKTSRTNWKREERGFSFIEVLVVMGIIAVLAGLATVTLQIIGKRKPEFATETRVMKLAAVVGSFRQKFERYPPSDLTRIQRTAGGPKGIKKVPNGYNEGAVGTITSMIRDVLSGARRRA